MHPLAPLLAVITDLLLMPCCRQRHSLDVLGTLLLDTRDAALVDPLAAPPTPAKSAFDAALLPTRVHLLQRRNLALDETS